MDAAREAALDRFLVGLDYEVRMTQDGVAEIIPTDEEIGQTEVVGESEADLRGATSEPHSDAPVLEREEREMEGDVYPSLLHEIFGLLDGPRDELRDNMIETNEGTTDKGCDDDWVQVEPVENLEEEEWTLL